MKILLTGPNIYEKGKFGGIITVVDIILELFPDTDYFSRSSEKAGSRLKALFDFFKVYAAYNKALKKRYDLVHINTSLMDSAIIRDYFLCLLAKRKGSKVLLHIHGGKYFLNKPGQLIRRLIRGMLHNSNGVIILGDTEKEFMHKEYDISHVYIIPNALNFQDVPEPSPKFSDKTLRLLFFGRLVAEKGVYEILEALENIKKEGSIAFQYNVYGNGKLEESYPEEGRRKLGDNFYYGGTLGPDDRWEALNAHDIMLLPSYFEGLPLTLLEAMAVKSLCLITPVGSIGEVITDKKNGLFVDPKNSAQIKEALEWIDQHRDEARQLANEGNITVRKMFHESVYKERLENVYEKLF